MDVLLVEDDEATAHVLRLLLESVGMLVQRVASVAAAITALGTEPPALIVLDLRLPDGSGVEVLRAARKAKLASKVAVVSAANDPQLLASVSALNPDAIFGKPLDFDDFIDWMSTIFTEDCASATRLTA